MASKLFYESYVEEAALEWLTEQGYEAAFGPDITGDGLRSERASHEDVLLIKRLKNALITFNPALPKDAIEDAVRSILIPKQVSLISNNRVFHKMITDGVNVSYHDKTGRLIHTQAKVFDFENPFNNDFLAVNQFTVIENRIEKRPDLVVFVNGIPLVVFA